MHEASMDLKEGIRVTMKKMLRQQTKLQPPTARSQAIWHEPHALQSPSETVHLTAKCVISVTEHICGKVSKIDSAD